MISRPIISLADPAGKVVTAEYDQWEATAQTGGLTMRRTRRDGRNPSTGARGSRRYGQTITFITTLAPLTGTNAEFIY